MQMDTYTGGQEMKIKKHDCGDGFIGQYVKAKGIEFCGQCGRGERKVKGK